MEITYRTKEESKEEQEKDFLKLSPAERFYSFLNLMYELKDFPVYTKTKDKNYTIIIDEKNSLGQQD